MRIAHVLAFQASRPGEERASHLQAVSYLAEGLVREGHEAVLLDGGVAAGSAASACDVVHLHLDRAAIPAGWRSGLPAVATLHGSGEGQPSGLRALEEIPLVAVSDAQRARQPSLPWATTISNGIPEMAFGFREGRGGYLAVLGPMRPGSGMDRAIEIARRSGRRIRIASSPQRADPGILPVRDRAAAGRPARDAGRRPGEQRPQHVSRRRRRLLQLAGSSAHPDLTAIEALASGTPVVRCGPFAAQESFAEGIVDFAAATLSEAVDAVGRVGQVERRHCREIFERRFTASEMARRYLALYRALSARSAGGRCRSTCPPTP